MLEVFGMLVVAVISTEHNWSLWLWNTYLAHHSVTCNTQSQNSPFCGSSNENVTLEALFFQFSKRIQEAIILKN